MTSRARTRYFIRSADGEELICPTLADLHSLYAQGFLSDDDLVRAENSPRWVPAGSMPALHGVRESRGDPRRILMILAAALILTLALALLVRGAR